MHIPVLQKEVIEYLDPKTNDNFIDATFGEGRHTLAILEKNDPKGKVLGIEWDFELYQKLKEKYLPREIKQRLVLVNDSYSNLKEIVKRENFKKVSGILFDLGLSSWHLEGSGRGFSFQRNEPLDMRYSIKTKDQKPKTKNNQKPKTKNELTAEKIVNEYSEKELEKILKEYGQERFSKQISKEIIETRRFKPIKTTFQLVEIIKKAVPRWYWHRKIHFATRTFQALRIAVNDELENLKKALPQTLEILEPGGRLVIISFHSLEDRIVKNFLRENQNLIKILTKKPVRPTIEEIKTNPRCRSAKLRAGQLKKIKINA